MIAAFSLLHRSLALGAILNVVFKLERLQCLGIEGVLVLGAGHAFVGDGFAFGADAGETGGAEEDDAFFGTDGFVGFDAVN